MSNATTKKQSLGDTEKTVLVGALILGAWLGLDVLVKRASRRDQDAEDDGTTTPARRRMQILRARREGRLA